MDSKKIIELENYIFKIVKREPRAASKMADIIGVLCGVKPTMATFLNEEELKDLDLVEYIEMFNKLGLEVLIYERFHCTRGRVECTKDCYISKDIELAKRIYKAFNELWSSMDSMGQTVELEKWEKATREVGELLGYPKTAIDSFIKDIDLEDEGRIKIMERNRYYAHSVEHEEDEYNQYDRKINEAISKYAPKTTNYMIKNKEKRWL